MAKRILALVFALTVSTNSTPNAEAFDRGMTGTWQCVQKGPQGNSRLLIDITPEGDYTLQTTNPDGTLDEEQGQMEAEAGRFTSTSDDGSACNGMYRISGKRMTIFIENSGGCVWQRVPAGSSGARSGLGTGIQQTGLGTGVPPAANMPPGAPTGPTSSDYQPGAPTISGLRRGVANSTGRVMRNGLLNALSPITRGMPNFAQYTIKSTAHDGAHKVTDTIMGTQKHPHNSSAKQKAAVTGGQQQVNQAPAEDFAPTYVEETPPPRRRPRKSEEQSGF